MQQMTIFDYCPELIQKPVSEESNLLDEAVLRGTGFVNGMDRVLGYFLIEKDEKKRASFLKNEYGIGGGTFKRSYFLNHDANGIDIDLRDEPMGKTVAIHMGWPMVAKRIDRLISEGRYQEEAKKRRRS